MFAKRICEALTLTLPKKKKKKMKSVILICSRCPKSGYCSAGNPHQISEGTDGNQRNTSARGDWQL